jgi:hypothetical protein
LKEKRPEEEGMFLIFTPPISSEFHVFSGGRIVVGRGASVTGATVDEGWLALGEDCEGSEVEGEETVSGGGLTRLGLVIGMADLVTVREAIALARARWCGDRDERIICGADSKRGSIRHMYMQNVPRISRAAAASEAI